MTSDELHALRAALNEHGWVFAWRDNSGKLQCAQPTDWNTSSRTTGVVLEATAQKCKNYTMPDGSIITICR